MYSQNNEEQYILDALSHLKTGTFVEIGSFDPFTFSNTRCLVELGWGGVYVEPSTPCFNKFVKEYENNDKIILVNKAIAQTTGQMKFYECEDAISTTDDAHKLRCEHSYGTKFVERLVDTITGKELFDTYCDVVDFLSIDTESTNIEVLNSIPKEYIQKCRVVCIEHDHQLAFLRNYFSEIGFVEILYTGENLIFKNTNI